MKELLVILWAFGGFVILMMGLSQLNIIEFLIYSSVAIMFCGTSTHFLSRLGATSCTHKE